MPFNNSGTYTPPSGSENATPGSVIRSATWNSIFTDLATALTTLGNIIYTQNVRVINTNAAVTILTTDSYVEVTVSVTVINLPASSLMLWPVRIFGAGSSGVFGTGNAVITPNGAQTISGQSSFTLGTNYQTVKLIPLSTGGWFLAP